MKAAKRMSEWETIDSAPKDGTMFLAITGRTQYICEWGSHFLMGRNGPEYGWVNSHSSPGNIAHPKAWMPLPEPPNDPQ